MSGGQPRAVVLISGSGTNLAAIIDEVNAGKLPLTLSEVISDRPGAFGLERAARAGIATRVVDYRAGRAAAERDLDGILGALAPDVVVLAGFMRILPDRIVARHAGRMLNVHPSLLPKYRGLDTYRRVLAAGDTHHGSTVHFVIPELDAGPAIIQYRLRVRPNDTPDSLAARTQRGEYLVYPRALRWLAAGRLVLDGDTVHLDGEPLDGPVVVDADD